MKKNVNLNLNLQKNGLVVLVAVGAVAILAIGWFALLSPKQKQIDSLKQQTAAVQQQITDDIARAATARSATSAPQIKTADIYKLETAMPSAVDMPDLLLELDQTAKAAGVSIQSIAPSPSLIDTGNGYGAEHIVLAANGNFYTLTDLLYRLRNMVYGRGGALESNGRIFNIDSVTITPLGSALTANITLDTFVYGAVASATPGVAAPASTDTTATTTTTTTTTSTPSSGPTAAGATP